MENPRCRRLDSLIVLLEANVPATPVSPGVAIMTIADHTPQ